MSDTQESPSVEDLTPEEANRIIHSHRKVRYGMWIILDPEYPEAPPGGQTVGAKWIAIRAISDIVIGATGSRGRPAPPPNR
jgi:hypothetical protein